jgi:glycerol-3-phosphate acyltransferase PlsY
MHYIIVIVLSYFIGSIPFSYIVPKVFGKIDIRSVGSGNTGTTNVVRTLGLKIGALAFFGDYIKGVIPAFLGLQILGFNGALIAGTVCVLGHCYPVWLNFKGGKGIATSVGVLTVTFPYMALGLLIWQFAVIFATKYMSLASITSALFFPISVLIFRDDMPSKIFAVFLGGFVIYRHRANLKRLLNGTEKKLTIGKKDA